MAEATATKVCTKCDAEKPLDDFSRNRRSPTGRASRCRECDRLAAKKWRAANPEAVREKNRHWREANVERKRLIQADWYQRNKDRTAENNRKWRQANPGRAAENQRRFLSANPEYKADWSRANADRNRAYQAKHRLANLEKFAERMARRRAAERQAEIGEVDLDALWDGLCGICTEPLSRDLCHPDPQSKSLDHIVPLARGGAHTQANLQWAHLICNIRKGTRLPASSGESDDDQRHAGNA